MAHVNAAKCNTKRRIKDGAEVDRKDKPSGYGHSGRYLRPHHCDDEEMMDELASGTHYQDSYFAENVEVTVR